MATAWITGFADEIGPSIEEQMDVLDTLGIAAIELRGVDGKNVSQLTLDEARAISTKMRARGFSVSALGTPIGKSPIDQAMEPVIDTFNHLCDIADILGTNAMRIFSFFVPKETADDYADQVVERLKMLIDIAKARHILLLHENELGIFGDTKERCLLLAKKLECDAFALLFDPSNSVQNGEDALECWRMVKPHVRYLHMKDSFYKADPEDRSNPHCVVGDGDGQLPAIIQDIARGDYRGYFSIEPHLHNSEHVPGTDVEKWIAAAKGLLLLLEKCHITIEKPPVARQKKESNMDQVRYGVIGTGGMGKAHLRNFVEGKIPQGVVTAICDINPEKRQQALEILGHSAAEFECAEALMDSGLVDAVLIATQHYFHPELAIMAMRKGLHVMSEKPAGVYTAQVREMNAVADECDVKFGIMFQHRGEPIYRKMKAMVSSGEVGEIKRVNLIFTDRYRPQGYYDSGAWRATWGGEGGGVLINQCPHSLDLWQWIVGMMPTKVRAFCHEGKWHDIEVEDDVSAYLEYPNGATCLFTTCTADAPGINRIEITGDNGRLLAENGKLTFYRLKTPERQFNRDRKEPGIAMPESETIEIPLEGEFLWHPFILNEFNNAILHGGVVYVDGHEGIKGLTLSNAMMLSSWTGETVELPLDEARFLEELQKRAATSRFDGKY